MNTVVFSWINPIRPVNGGVERVTQRLMDGLVARGFRCLFLLHEPDKHRFVFEGETVDLGRFLTQYDVSALVNQNGYSSSLSEAVSSTGWKGRYIVCFHSEPRYLRKLYDLRGVVSEIFSTKLTLRARSLWILRLLVFPVWRKWSDEKIGKMQQINYDACTSYVLLSPAFRDQFGEIVRRSRVSKVVTVPNPLSFGIHESTALSLKKEKTVLIVARLNDAEKRISAALHAWKIVEKNGFNDWTLQVVGSGPDEKNLKRLSSRLRLERVSFLDRQPPLGFFRSASIFLMTSRIEGWGLTLTEAMETGTVPIAFDAFPSLRDIVTNDHSGLIVENGNVKALAQAIQRLMKAPTYLRTLSVNAITMSQRFRLDIVLDQWHAVLQGPQCGSADSEPSNELYI